MDHMEWYNQFMVTQLMVNQGVIDEQSPKDWARLQIYDPKAKKYVPAMEEGFKGTPSSEEIERLYKAFQEGNLYVYELSKTEPSRLELSIDGGLLKTNPVYKNYRDEMADDDFSRTNEELEQEPKGTDYVKKISGLKLLLYRWFNWFKEEAEEYNRGVDRLEKALAIHNKLKEDPTFAERRERAAAAERQKGEREPEVDKREEANIARFRTSAQDERYWLWKLDRVNETMDKLFANRPQKTDPQVYSENPPAEGVISKTEFNRLEAHGYDLPEGCKFTPREVATINYMLLGSTSVTKPVYQVEFPEPTGMMAENTVSGTFSFITTAAFLDPRKGMRWSGVHAAFDSARDMIADYVKTNDPTKLGKCLGEGFRMFHKLGDDYTSSKSLQKGGMGLIAERMLELLENHQDLREASGLTEEDMEYARSQVAVSKIFRNAAEARIKLKQADAYLITLNDEEKAQCIADIGLNAVVFDEIKMSKEASENSPEQVEKSQKAFNAYKNAIERMKKEVDALGVKNAEYTIASQKWAKENGEPRMYLDAAYRSTPLNEFQKTLGKPGAVEKLIQDTRDMCRRRVKGSQLDIESQMKLLKDNSRLLKTIRDGIAIDQEERQFNENKSEKSSMKEKTDTLIEEKDNKVKKSTDGVVTLV